MTPYCKYCGAEMVVSTTNFLKSGHRHTEYVCPNSCEYVNRAGDRCLHIVDKVSSRRILKC